MDYAAYLEHSILKLVLRYFQTFLEVMVSQNLSRYDGCFIFDAEVIGVSVLGVAKSVLEEHVCDLFGLRFSNKLFGVASLVVWEGRAMLVLENLLHFVVCMVIGSYPCVDVLCYFVLCVVNFVLVV